ncbi:MAG: hypothetical protein ACREXP_00140 [Steroidobacteraceae bacterium]
MNPYVLLGAGILAISLAVGGFTFGVKYQRGQEARAVLLIEKVRDEAQLGAAAAIAANKPVTQIIKQKLETEIREVEVYRDCRNSDAAMRLLNDALTGANSLSVDSGELPRADASDR